MAKIDQLLKFMVKAGASDLHLSSNSLPKLRIDGDMRSVSGEKSEELTAFASSNPDAVKAFQEFYLNDLKSTVKQVIDNQKAAMQAKKEADAKAEAEESKAAKAAQLDAFITESKDALK